jgi:hypothetical protein
LFNLAGLLYSNREFTKALHVIDKLLELDPHDQDAHEKRRQILIQPVEPERMEAPPLYNIPVVMRPVFNVDYDGTVAPIDGSVTRPIDFVQVKGMTREEASGIVGSRAWDIVKLRELVNNAVSRTKPPQHPVLFLSYRWHDREHKQWVKQFADDLVKRGYEIVFDKHFMKESSPPQVPELVAKMAACSFFVPILTEEYRRRIEIQGDWVVHTDDGWVFDEWQTALLLASASRLKFIGVWRTGPIVPLPFRKDNVLDFCDDADYQRLMDRHFPPSKVMVIGLRADNTRRVVSPIHPSKAREVARELERTGEFVGIQIVDAPNE